MSAQKVLAYCSAFMVFGFVMAAALIGPTQYQRGLDDGRAAEQSSNQKVADWMRDIGVCKWVAVYSQIHRCQDGEER